jgi:hypothetical protein
MKAKRAIVLLLLLAPLLVPVFVDARSGCCSHHGGVCGCGCCDGSPLSATCAPYYPECQASPGAGSGDSYNLSIPAVPVASPCPSFSTYDNLTGKCECANGYVLSGSSCISVNQDCINRYGFHSHGNTQGCFCDTGYQLNSLKTTCIQVPTPIPSVNNSPKNEMNDKKDQLKVEDTVVSQLPVVAPDNQPQEKKVDVWRYVKDFFVWWFK